MGAANSMAMSLVDVGANMTPLWAYRWAGVGGTSTLTGYYTDLSGRQISPLITVAIPAADGSAVATLADGVDPASAPYPIPGSATAFVGALTDDVYQGTGGKDSGGLQSAAGTTEPNTGYPQVPAGNLVIFGRAS